jgi:hypothetical protein
MEFVPVQSYHKATLAQLYDNEGEARWDIEKLKKEIHSNKSLWNELLNTGYKERSKSFTGHQVSLIFKYLSRPILNLKNMKLLKIKNFDLLQRFDENHSLITNDFEQLDKIPEAALIQLGLRKHNMPEENEHYTFTENEDIYLLKKQDGFEIHCRKTFKLLEYIKDTKSLIVALLHYKNCLKNGYEKNN